MKYFIRIASISGLILLSQLANSAPITDNYVTGDALTAATMNNIKSAVNDNDANIAGKQSLVTGACAEGFSIRVINANGTVICEADNTGGAPDFGTILTVETVTGASGETGTATINCPDGAYATGGSCGILVYNAPANLVKVDEPVMTGPSPTGWTCTCKAASGQICAVKATAICAQ